MRKPAAVLSSSSRFRIWSTVLRSIRRDGSRLRFWDFSRRLKIPGCELRRRRQGSLLHAFHANGRIQENGLDRRPLRSESLASRRSYACARGLRGQRVQGREPGRADPPDCLGSAHDALRPPRVAEATRCRRLQRSEVAGQVGECIVAAVYVNELNSCRLFPSSARRGVLDVQHFFNSFTPPANSGLRRYDQLAQFPVAVLRRITQGAEV